MTTGSLHIPILTGPETVADTIGSYAGTLLWESVFMAGTEARQFL